MWSLKPTSFESMERCLKDLMELSNKSTWKKRKQDKGIKRSKIK
jgi:hypothetical protein